MDISEILSIVSITGIVVTPIVSGAVVWGVTKTRINGMSDQIKKLDDWKLIQTQICSGHLLDYGKEHERLKGEVTAQHVLYLEQNKEILRRLDRIELIVDRRDRDGRA